MSTLSQAEPCGVCQNISSFVVLAMAMVFVVAASPANAQTFTTLHSFTSTPDGANPFGGLVADGNGNYYGTTQFGGASNNGSVFELSPPGVSGGDWTETVVWSFAGGVDGSAPSFQMVLDGKGRLYGETLGGGDANCGCGTVFVLAPPQASGGNWSKHVLYIPTTGANGNSFYGGLVLDSSGALYGSQWNGGTFNGGLAFKITPAAGGFTERTIYDFRATHTDSYQPYGPLTLDSTGNLYGASAGGGADGGGTVYKLTPPITGTGLWSNSVLRSFYGNEGCSPQGNVVLDKQGRLYGQTTHCVAGVYRLTPPTGSGPWTISMLHTFSSTDRGFYPSLSLDAKTGAFYGTSFYGGGNGVVFKLTPPAGGVGQWTETVLHTFGGGSDGWGPVGPVVWDSSGVLYGTAYYGNLISPLGYGTVFSIAP